MFSKRSHIAGQPNALARALQLARGKRRPLLDLTQSNPTAAGLEYPAELWEALTPAALAHYTPDPQGQWTAREALANELTTQGYNISPQDLYLVPSTSDAYGYLFKLLCDPGDNVLIPQPSYPLFEHLAKQECITTRPYSLRYDGSYHIETASLTEQAGPRSRAIITVHPNNPTGSYVHLDELAALSASGLPLISDEVFLPYHLTVERPSPRSLLQLLLDQPVFALQGLSKAAGLPQLKLAWIAVGGPSNFRAQVRARLSFICDSYLSTSAPVQHALPTLLRRLPQLQAQIRQRLQDNLRQLGQALGGECPITRRRVEGGWYATLQLPRVLSAEDWALHLLHKAELLTQPGYFYDFSEEGILIVSLLTPPETFRIGISRLRDTVEAYVGH